MQENQIVEEKRSELFFHRLPRWLILVMTLLVPVFFFPVAYISPQFGTSLLFAFGVIVSVVIYIISGLVSSSLDLPRSSKHIVAFMSVVPIVYTLAGISNGFSRMAFFGYTFDISTVGFILLGFSYMFIVSILFREKKLVFYSYFTFMVSAIILALFFVSRLVFGVEFLSFGLFKDLSLTPIGSFNNLAIFFGIVAILSLVTYQTLSIGRAMKVMLSVALVASLLFLSAANFTFAWIALAISSFLYVLYSIFNYQNSEFDSISFLMRVKKVPLYPSIVLVISIIFIIWSGSFGSYLSSKLNIVSLEVRPDFRTTMSIALNTIKSKPLFGSGPNTFVNQWLAYRPNEVLSTEFWNTDFASGIGLIPTFAVTTGVAGVISWFVFLGFYLYIGVKSIFVKIEDLFSQYLITSSFFVSLYLWIMTFIYVPSTAIFVLTFFFTGLFFASIYLNKLVHVETKMFSLNPRAGFVSSFIFVVAFVVSIGLGYGLLRNLQSIWYFQKSSYAITQLGDISSSESYILKAIEAVPNDIYFRSLSQIEILKLNAIVSQDPNKVKPEEIQKQFGDTLTNAIKAGLAAKDADSNNYLNWISLGQVYEAVAVPALKIDGAYESAELAYKEALDRNPKSPVIPLFLARLAVTKGDLKLARQRALQSINQKRNYLDAYFLLSQIEVADKNIKGAIDAVTASSVIDPTNPAIFFQLGLLKYNTSDFNGAIEALEKATSMTPDYANAKYFLGLSYEAIKQHEKAIAQFEQLKVTNPDSKEVAAILENLKAGKSIFTDVTETKPEKGKTLPVKEKVQ